MGDRGKGELRILAGRAGLVVVADHDKNARTAAAKALRRAGHDVREVATGAEALNVAREEAVALLLLEVMLPDVSGYQVCRELRDEGGDEPPIFLLSETRAEPYDRVAGLLLGADDVIAKPLDTGELVARAARYVTREGRASEPEGTTAATGLTPREEEILVLLSEGRRTKEIATTLSISPKTVATHVQRVHAKLGVHSRAELIAWAYRFGPAGARA